MRFENEPAMPLQRAAEIPARSSEEQRAIAAVLRCYFAALVGKSERFRGSATPASAFPRFYQRQQRRARWRHEEILPSAQDRRPRERERVLGTCQTLHSRRQVVPQVNSIIALDRTYHEFVSNLFGTRLSDVEHIANPRCYLLLFRPGIEVNQQLDPDPATPCVCALRRCKRVRGT